MDALKQLIKKIIVMTPLKKWVTVNPINRPLVLMYHRINTLPQARGIRPSQFEKHLIELKQHFSLIKLADFSTSKKKETAQVVLTFDDGHDDFYQYAWPLLKKYNLPATLFVTTAFIDNKDWLWPDKLRFILENTEQQDFELIEQEWQQHADKLLGLSAEEREIQLKRLAQARDTIVPAEPPSEYRALSWARLQEMAAEGLDVQCHTHTHPILSMLKRDDIAYELAHSKQLIEDHIDEPVTAICYPNGRLEDVSYDVIDLAEAIGFKQGLLAANYHYQEPLMIGRIPATYDTTELLWRLYRNDYPAQETL